MRGRILLAAFSAVLTMGCASLQYSAWRTFTHDGRLQKHSDEAWLLLEDEKARESDEAYRKLRARAPEDPFEAFAHARALMTLGDTEEAWRALDAALANGFKDVWRLERDPRLAPLRDDPRFAGVVARARDNLRVWNGLVAEAKRPADPAAALSFDSWEAVEKSVRESNVKAYRLRYSRDAKGERELAAHRLRQQNLAKIRRYVLEHPGADDLEDAMLGEVVERVEMCDPWMTLWPSDEAAAIAEAAARFLSSYPESPSRSTAELHRAVALLRGVLPESGPEPGREKDYVPNCGPAMPLLESLAARADSDPRGADAEGFLGYCLWEGNSRDEDRALKLAASFLERDGGTPEGTAYGRMKSELRKIVLRAGSLPAFEVKDLAGNTWTPGALKGRVTILQFWSPG